MKNKNVISSVVGAGFFAVGYLGLMVPLAPALALGGAAFVASELIMGGAAKQEEIKELTFKEKIKVSRKNNEHIKDMIKSVDDIEVEHNLKEITITADKILNAIEKNDLHNKTANKFIDYYLPVCVKIVDKYDEIENQRLTSSDSKKFMIDGKKIIKDTNKAFKKILDSLYQTDILSSDAEMKVYNSILKSDGYDDELLDIKEGDDNE
ncbi:MAG: 5-bromo-4-chloroindolyl phosphate hydrolysis family protein [Bacilli bacterium]|nr:5-bromo-4-chloroindolyl phosphate hydrolysis family protein [Bacilli bacterium]